MFEATGSPVGVVAIIRDVSAVHFARQAGCTLDDPARNSRDDRLDRSRHGIEGRERRGPLGEPRI